MTIFGATGRGFPFSPMGARMSNTCSTEATARKSASLAKCRPGHILRPAEVNGRLARKGMTLSHLRPKPNWNFSGSMTWAAALSECKNLSGINFSGCGYATRSCDIALHLREDGAGPTRWPGNTAEDISLTRHLVRQPSLRGSGNHYTRPPRPCDARSR